MAWFRRHLTTEGGTRPVSTLEDATRALERSNSEFADAVHHASKNIEAAREVRSQRLKNHIGPSMAEAIARLR